MGIQFNARRKLQVKVGSFVCPAGTGNYSVIVGFKPRCVEFKVGGTDLGNFIRVGTGWMDYNGNQGIAVVSGDEAPDMHSKVYIDRCVSIITQVGAAVIVATYVSMDNNGFTINFNPVDVSYTILWKAVR